MFYVKTKLSQDVEIKVTLNDDEFYTQCDKCGKEIQLCNGSFANTLEKGDLETTVALCEDCMEQK